MADTTGTSTPASLATFSMAFFSPRGFIPLCQRLSLPHNQHPPSPLFSAYCLVCPFVLAWYQSVGEGIPPALVTILILCLRICFMRGFHTAVANSLINPPSPLPAVPACCAQQAHRERVTTQEPRGSIFLTHLVLAAGEDAHGHLSQVIRHQVVHVRTLPVDQLPRARRGVAPKCGAASDANHLLLLPRCLHRSRTQRTAFFAFLVRFPFLYDLVDPNPIHIANKPHSRTDVDLQLWYAVPQSTI